MKAATATANEATVVAEAASAAMAAAVGRARKWALMAPPSWRAANVKSAHRVPNHVPNHVLNHALNRALTPNQRAAATAAAARALSADRAQTRARPTPHWALPTPNRKLKPWTAKTQQARQTVAMAAGAAAVAAATVQMAGSTPPSNKAACCLKAPKPKTTPVWRVK